VRHFVIRYFGPALAMTKAENLLLTCTGTMTSQAYGEANIENQTLDIDLDSGQMKGFIGDQIRVQSWNDRSIVFSGPTFLGPSGGGVVNRVTGEPSRFAIALSCVLVAPRLDPARGDAPL
jgi:hypothetical protein